jgi:hypothetical protein
MAIGKITGQMLNQNLDRTGVDLAIDTNLGYFDVTNRRIGVNTMAPAHTLDIAGNAHLGNIYILGNTITTDVGKKLNLGDVTNVQINGGSNNYVLYTDGNGNLSFADVTTLVPTSVVLGSGVDMGANTVGSLVSSALALTTTTKVTDGIALLNNVLGKLVPTPPPSFPAGQSIALASTTTTARMANFTQTDNTLSGGKSVTGGNVVAATRTNSYATTAITTVGPGDSGTVSVTKNGTLSGSHIMTTGIDDGTYNDLVIASDQDYHLIQSSVPVGFYQSFNAYATGTATAGWNDVYLNDTITSGSTNTLVWYYDSSTPGAPGWSNNSVVLTSNSVTYSSTIPHLNTSAVFTLKANVSRLSGDMYHTSDTFVTGTAGGALATPSSVTYSQAGVTTPLARNLYVGAGSAYLQSTAGVISGFGSSSLGPSLTAFNSYASTAQVFNPGATVLYKTGTSNQIEETALVIGTVGIGSGAPYRIVNPGSTDTPIYTGTEVAFNSQTGPFYTYDATVVGSILKYDTTNYSTGYFPVGKNLSLQATGQYFTFRFVRSSVSKFDILYTGTIAGLWVALPGSTLDVTSSQNGWMSMSQPYNGSGIPGANFPGNGSDGCALGGTATLNSAVSNKSVTATFGTVSSSSTANNYIYVRVKLTSGQSLTALQIQAATH